MFTQQLKVIQLLITINYNPDKEIRLYQADIDNN